MKRVYFIKPVGMAGPVKIGCSASPDGRRRALESWSPFALEIVAEIDGDFDLERRFHARFRDTHQRREWFDWSPELQAVIDAIRAQTFDVTTLPAPFSIANCKNGARVRRTPEQCLQLSYSLRETHTSHRTGYRPRLTVYGVVERGDALGMAYLDAFFSEPHRWGDAPDWPAYAKARKAYHRKLAAVAPTRRRATNAGASV